MYHQLKSSMPIFEAAVVVLAQVVLEDRSIGNRAYTLQALVRVRTPPAFVSAKRYFSVAVTEVMAASSFTFAAPLCGRRQGVGDSRTHHPPRDMILPRH